MRRFVPPAGAPLELRQVLRAFARSFTRNGSGRDSIRSFAAQLQVPHVFAVSSGRAALWVIFRALRKLRPDRCVVAIPAYTCFSVPASAVRAGLKIWPADMDPESLDLDASQLDRLPRDGLLGLLTSNLFGLTNDLSRIQEVARSRGAYLVDNAAQALGAAWNGCLAGTCGDVGFFSMGRGKALAAGEGGLIVTRSQQIAESLQAEVQSLSAPSFAHSIRLLVQLVAYAIFLHPSFYWIPNSLPFLRLGVTEFDPGFPARRLAGVSQALLPQLMAELGELNQVRRCNARTIVQGLAGNPSFTIPKIAAQSQPSFIRFPLVARDEATRNRAANLLRAAGIGVSTFYPSAICDIANIAPHMATADFHRPMAEGLSRRLLTLPTHPFVTGQDLSRMTALLSKV